MQTISRSLTFSQGQKLKLCHILTTLYFVEVKNKNYIKVTLRSSLLGQSQDYEIEIM